MAARPRDREFCVLWLDLGPIERDQAGYTSTPRPKVIGRTYLKRHDMSDALTAAAGLFKRGADGADGAYGYAVAPVKDYS